MSNKDNLRYYYKDGVVKLVEFDPFTREPLNTPEGLEACQICVDYCFCGGSNCGRRMRHYVTPNGGVWNVSEETLREHLATELLIRAKKDIPNRPGKRFIFWSEVVRVAFCCLFLLAYVSIGGVAVAFGFYNPPANPKLEDVVLFGVYALGFFACCAAFGGYTEYLRAKLYKKIYGLDLVTNESTWQDFLKDVPELDLPVPGETKSLFTNGDA